MELIKLHNICRSFQSGSLKLQVLKGITATIHQGEFVALMGTSGSGKSTLMNILGFLDRPSSGDYWFQGQAVSGLSADERALLRNQKIGFIFQSFNLLPRISALDNVLLPMTYADHSLSESEARQKAKDLLMQVGLKERINHDPFQLSGGEQQRVAIARSLINQPELLLADEPTGNLDSHNSFEVLEMFKQLNQNEKKTVLLVTHEIETAEVADRIIYMRDGILVENKSVEPSLINTY